MELNRNEARVVAMTILYQIDLFQRKKIPYQLDEVIEANLEEGNEFVSSLVHGVLEQEVKIVKLANDYLQTWDFSRLGYTDRAIMKIAIYELIETDTPDKVCIDEAIELAKRYSDLKVVGMINGVLDKIYHQYTEEKEAHEE